MKAKNVVLVLAATGLISSQAFAADAGVKGMSAGKVETFTEADASALFEQTGQPMEMVSLSSAEMKETEGAVWPILIPVLGGAAMGAGITIGDNLLAGESIDWTGAAISGGIGAVTGGAGAALGRAAGSGFAGGVGRAVWDANMTAIDAMAGLAVDHVRSQP